MDIFSHFDEVTIPTDFNTLTSSIFLSCGVIASDVDFTTRWITPDGTIITPTSSDDRLTVIDGISVDIDGRPFDGTALILRSLSYMDEGLYACEAREVLEEEQESPWRQAVTQLNLLGEYSS